MTKPSKGRGAVSNAEGRFETRHVSAVYDGWTREDGEDDDALAIETVLRPDPSKSILIGNDSPDIPFEVSINPYKGCEHGCIYCYARPSHGYLNLSAGLDFESRIFFKPDAASLLDAALRAPAYRCKTIAIGANTDPYQPAERELKVTRGLLEVAQRFNQPVSMITKGALVERDIDLLAPMAQRRLASVAVSVTTLDNGVKRTLEPRAASPAARLRTIERLSAAGIPVTVLVAPVIPAVTDHELETILERAADAGARHAGYILLRLPYEVKDLFREWLDVHLPLRKKHVMSIVQQCRGGKDYTARFGERMTGTGPFAKLLQTRFRAACRRYGLDRSRGESGGSALDTSRFQVPPAPGDQLGLFG
ncbi:MAG: PA0069 family radical SAM protein [Pseudomonadota bacterium]